MTTFATLNPDGTLSEVREIEQGDLLKCPHTILVAAHYREDGSCKCNDPAERDRMIGELGYSASDFKGIPLLVAGRATPSCPPQRDPTGVVWKNVTSANPDKKRIQAHLRRAAGVTGGKVTLVKVSKDGRLVIGHVMTPTMATTPAGTRHRSNVSHGMICCDHPDHTQPDESKP